MTLEQLLEMDASTLEKMSDEDLRKHFEPMLNVTRPERQTSRPTNSNQPRIVEYISPKKQAILDLLKNEGFDYLAEKRKKK
jgi:hypothetical protein